MSILFSVARIIRPTERMHCVVTALASFFSLVFLTFIAMKIWWFAHDLSWLEGSTFYSRPARWLPRAMYAYELCGEYAHCLSGLS